MQIPGTKCIYEDSSPALPFHFDCNTGAKFWWWGRNSFCAQRWHCLRSTGALNCEFFIRSIQFNCQGRSKRHLSPPSWTLAEQHKSIRGEKMEAGRFRIPLSWRVWHPPSQSKHSSPSPASLPITAWCCCCHGHRGRLWGLHVAGRYFCSN